MEGLEWFHQSAARAWIIHAGFLDGCCWLRQLPGDKVKPLLTNDFALPHNPVYVWINPIVSQPKGGFCRFEPSIFYEKTGIAHYWIRLGGKFPSGRKRPPRKPARIALV